VSIAIQFASFEAMSSSLPFSKSLPIYLCCILRLSYIPNPLFPISSTSAITAISVSLGFFHLVHLIDFNHPSNPLVSLISSLVRSSPIPLVRSSPLTRPLIHMATRSHSFGHLHLVHTSRLSLQSLPFHKLGRVTDLLFEVTNVKVHSPQPARFGLLS